MSYYGNNFYSLATYGPTTLVDFDASPVVAKSADYGKINLTWTKPGGSWDSLILVRNTYGFSVTPDDGDLLLTTVAQTYYNDIGLIPNSAGLIPGQTYYYTIFVRKISDSTWYRAGAAIGLSVKNYGTADLMYQYLPEIYTVNYENYNSGLETNDNDDLRNFLKIFAFEHDYLKTMTENAKHKYNALKVDGRMLPGLLNQYGFVYEKELGLQQARKLFANASAIYTKKGSLAGLKNFTTAFSGYNATTLPVKNLMLNVNDSSFETDVGGWNTIVNATLSTINGASESPAVSPYSESTAPSNFPNKQAGLLKVVATAAADATFTCGNTAPKTKGIPVTASSAYSFSIYSRAKTATKSIVLAIYWYDRDGAFISTTTGTGTSNSTSAWTRISLANATAPSNAYFAVPYVKITSALASEVHYFDAAQFEKSTTVTNFVDARRIDILLNANRVNLVTNPNFETDVSRWSCTGTLSRTTSSFYFGTASAQVVCTAQSQIVYIDYPNSSSATASTIYTSSAYVLAELGKPFSIELRNYDSSGNYLGAATQGAIGTGAWQRVSLTATSASTATKIGVGIRNNFAGAHTFYVDGVLVEQSSTVNPYFDGSNGYYQSGDLLWENGTPNAGRSFYYKNYQTVTKRLITVLPDYLPFGAPWALFVAQTP